MDVKYWIKSSCLYPFWCKIIKNRNKRLKKNELLQEALAKFKEEKPAHGSIADYKKALDKHLVSYSEYMYQYEFWHLDEVERDKFISRSELSFRVYYDVPWKVKRKFWDKVEFLSLFSRYIHREWMCAKYVSFDVFKTFILQAEECIAKPLENCCGVGIFKIVVSVDLDRLQELYAQCVAQNVLLEQRIEGCQSLQSFHPQSLNTIRVVTVNGIVFGAFFRMGVGNNLIDNAHAGGIFAQINVETGIIESDGLDTNGNYYAVHPDTFKRIKGFKIPRWEEIKTVCMEAAAIVPQNPITGWDVVINKCDKIEFVEGNHGPDFDVMQSPLKLGVKEKLYKYLSKK